MYRWEVSSSRGLVQQLASNILPHGYWFYVTGIVPLNKDPRQVDQKLMWKYGVSISRQQRVRRRQAGLANIHYLRFRQFWILLATHGEHAFFREEAALVRDARKVPIMIDGYSLSVKRGNYLHGQLRNHDQSGERLPLQAASQPPGLREDGRMRSRVQIARQEYLGLLAMYRHQACRRSLAELSQELRLLPWEPYAPIRKQQLNLLRIINQQRRTAGLQAVPIEVLRTKRRIVKVFVQD